MSTNRIIDLTVKELSFSITKQEEQELEALIGKNDKNRKVYEDTKTTWEKSKNYSIDIKVDAEASWNSFRKRLTKEPQTKVFTFSLFYKVAAAIIISIGIGIAVYNPWSSNIYKTGIGEILEVELPDRSLITLNENSSLTLSQSFNEEFRSVEFEGEAYFDIAENPERPFIIESKSSEIRVLGTSFNVDARKDREYVEVDVTSGRVSLSEIGNTSNQIILTVGMKGKFEPKTSQLVSVEYENQNFQSWRTDLLVFDDLKMSEVLNDMEEYFDIAVSAENEDILNCTFTSTFSKPTVEEVVEVLSLTLDLDYQKEGNQYTLVGEGCKEIQK